MYKQENWYLYLLKFTSLSTIGNMSGVLWICALNLVLIIILIPFYYWAKDQEPDSNRFIFFKNSILFCYGTFVIRFILSMLVWILISSTNEVLTFSKALENPVSYFFSLLFLLIPPLMLYICLYQWGKEGEKKSLNKLVLTKEFFSGTKDTSHARLYPVFWMLRRVLFVSIVFILKDYDYYISLGALASIQALYLGYIFFK